MRWRRGGRHTQARLGFRVGVPGSWDSLMLELGLWGMMKGLGFRGFASEFVGFCRHVPGVEVRRIWHEVLWLDIGPCSGFGV